VAGEVIVSSVASCVALEEIEAQYEQSPFIKEVCVVALTPSDDDAAPGGDGRVERLHAVVVPDIALLRARRIANVGDLLRFEIEGRGVYLPPEKRVHGYEVSFEPLPRTAAGKLKRQQIAEGLGAGSRGAKARSDSRAFAEWRSADAHVAVALDVICRKASVEQVTPNANLEIDLGLDSMQRVELLTELEQVFGVELPADRMHEIWTVAQLIEAVRSPDGSRTRNRNSDPWAVLLDDTSQSEPAPRSVLERRPLAVPVLFVVSRLIRLFLGPGVVKDVENLPHAGGCIISPNHQGYLDPFIVCGALPFRVFRDLFFVGATEYFETPLMRWLARKLNLLPVDPDANLVSALRASAFGLRHGKVLLVFPEGERSIDGNVKRFKKGAVILAQYAGVPVVPVAIRGTFELWPRNRAFNWRLLRPWSRHAVRIVFGEAVRFARGDDAGTSARRLREDVERLSSRL